MAVIGTKKIALKENVDGALDIIAEKGQSDLRKKRRKAVRSMDVILSDDVASSPPTFERSHSVDDRLDAADDYGSSFKSRYTILVSNNCDDIMVTLKGDHEFHLEKVTIIVYLVALKLLDLQTIKQNNVYTLAD